jgi:hypothetical protein
MIIRIFCAQDDEAKENASRKAATMNSRLPQNHKLPPVRPMSLTFGGTVPLEDIVGRDRMIQQLWIDLERASIAISEVRRFGKTTALHLMESRTPPGWICVRTTVQDAGSTSALIELTLHELLKHASIDEKIKNIVRSVGKTVENLKVAVGRTTFSLDTAFQDKPGMVFRSVLKDIASQLEKDDKRLAIIWDEFPDAIRAISEKEGPEPAGDIMSLFRALREQSGERIRWIVTGSIGFHHVLGKLRGRSGLINDLHKVSLEPLAPEYRRWMAECLILNLGRDYDPEGIEAIADVSGGIPYILELMVGFVRDGSEPVPKNRTAARQLLIEAAGSSMLGGNWAPLLERVGDYYGAHAELAESILDLAALGPKRFSEMLELLGSNSGTSPDKCTADKIVDLLIEDHYLSYSSESELYSWRHAPLQTIWLARRRIKA